MKDNLLEDDEARRGESIEIYGQRGEHQLVGWSIDPAK